MGMVRFGWSRGGVRDEKSFQAHGGGTCRCSGDRADKWPGGRNLNRVGGT